MLLEKGAGKHPRMRNFVLFPEIGASLLVTLIEGLSLHLVTCIGRLRSSCRSVEITDASEPASKYT